MKNKILPILLFLLFFSLIICSNCFAAEYTHEDTTVTLPDLPFDTMEHPYYIIIFNSGENRYQVGYPESDFGKVFTVKAYGTCLSYYIADTTTKGQWVFWQLNSDLDDWGNQRTTSAYYLQHVDYVLFSTLDIYTSADSDELFFRKTPVTLAQALEMNNPMKKLQIMMSGIIPYLIAFLVGLVAFWKAWQLLLKELRKA